MPTFTVSELEPVAGELERTSLAQYLACGPRRVEACSSPETIGVRLQVTHGLLGAADLAFRRHLPLTLSPDHFWITALQGLGTHLSLHPETLRGGVIRHQGQKRLVVVQQDGGHWEEVFTDFAVQIRDDVGPELYRDLVQGFSTTGPVERTVYDISLMAAMKSYYSYEVRTVCGIPQITLEGTRDDWQLLSDRVEKLAALGLGFWVQRVRPLLAEFIRVFDGEIDRDHWRNIYKMRQASGEPLTITGWLGRFLPYVAGKPNEVERVTIEMLPDSTCSAPFKWNAGGLGRHES